MGGDAATAPPPMDGSASFLARLSKSWNLLAPEACSSAKGGGPLGSSLLPALELPVGGVAYQDDGWTESE